MKKEKDENGNQIPDLPHLIYLTKQAVFETSGEYPDILDLPLKLYYELVFTLRELYGFEELYLDSWEGMEINLLWQNSNEFLVRKKNRCFVNGEAF